MRFLVAEPGPNFSVADVHAGWVEALRELGHEVITYPFSAILTFYGGVLVEVGQGQFRKALDGDAATALAADRLCAALYKCRPDVFISVSGFFLPTALFDTARMYGTKVVILHTESPYEDTRQLELAGHADLNFINDPTNLQRFQSVAPTFYAPHAYRPSLHRPGPPDPVLACDVSFVGTGFPSRVDFFERLDIDGLDLLLAGNWMHLDEDSRLRKHVAHDIEECLDNDKTVAIYQSTKIGLNLYRREAHDGDQTAGYAMGPREVEMAACGLFFLRDPRPESDDVLNMLPTFSSPEEAGHLIRWWLGHDAARQVLAAQAREAVALRTFTNHAAQLLRLLEKG